MTGDPTRRRQMLFAGAFALLLVAALILPPLININRYQRDIAASLSASLGRPVEVSGVRLHLLPQPAVEIGNLAVDAAPGFGAEPILQCSTVTASLRLSSLWRGQLEIARISLEEPSLNLERSDSGEWNFATVMLQAYRTAQAPTGRQSAGSQHRFPYIEASNARINFKHGNEKLPFSFLNADVSVWLEKPDEWQLRFAAQPVRTDINLSLADTGLVRMTGSIRRTNATASLPLDLHADWRKAPLGQVTRMLMTQDLGWRGDTSVTAHITGTPDAVAFDLEAAANDFHRESFVPPHPMNLHVHCTGTYRHVDGSLDDLRCISPVGEGSLDLSGSWTMLHSSQSEPDLKLAATGVPASAALDLLRHTRGRLSSDITLSGSIDGVLAYGMPARLSKPRAAAPEAILSGSWKATRLVLRQNDLEQSLPDLSFAVPASSPTSAVLQSARLDLGASQSLQADARLSAQGFQLHYSGTAPLKRLVPLARAFQVLPVAFQGLAEEGSADYNLTLQGTWTTPLTDAGLPAPASTIAGTLALRGASLQAGYLPEPLHITTATAVVSPVELRWNGVSAVLGKQHFSGSFRMPLPCRFDCVRHFDLNAAEVNMHELTAALRGDNQGVVRELLSRVRNRGADWPTLDGTLHIGRLVAGHVDIAPMTAQLTIDQGKVQVHSLDGHTLGGTVHATGVASFSNPRDYRAQVQMTRISATDLSQLMEEQWGPGTLDISSDLTMDGSTASDLSRSAKGTLHWQWTDGALPALTSSPLSNFARWTGDAKVTKGSLTLVKSMIVSNGEAASVTGIIGRDRSLDLKIGSASDSPTPADASDSGSIVSGTLAAPVAEPR